MSSAILSRLFCVETIGILCLKVSTLFYGNNQKAGRRPIHGLMDRTLAFHAIGVGSIPIGLEFIF